MSAISALLLKNGHLSPDDPSTISSHQFAMTAFAYMQDWITGPQALAEYNATLSENGQPNLTAGEQTDLAVIKTHYNNNINSGITPADAKSDYFETLHWATMRLQAGYMTEAEWDTVVGL